MKTYILKEINRAFLSKNTYISIGLIFFCILIGVIELLLGNSPSTDALKLFKFAHTDGTSTLLNLTFPILVSLPFASSYVTDMRSGILPYFYIKLGKTKYLTIRLIVNGIVGGFVLSFCLFISFLFFLLLEGNEMRSHHSISHVFFDVYSNSPILYVFLLIVNSFICGFIFSTLGLAASTIIKNNYLAVLFPFLFYIFSGTVLYQINRLLNSAIIYDLSFYKDLRLFHVLTYDVLLLSIGIITYFIGALRDEEFA